MAKEGKVFEIKDVKTAANYPAYGSLGEGSIIVAVSDGN